jgi:hypothetical protein
MMEFISYDITIGSSLFVPELEEFNDIENVSVKSWQAV